MLSYFIQKNTNLFFSNRKRLTIKMTDNEGIDNIRLAALQRFVVQHHTPLPTAVKGKQSSVIFRSTRPAPLVFYQTNKKRNTYQ